LLGLGEFLDAFDRSAHGGFVLMEAAADDRFFPVGHGGDGDREPDGAGPMRRLRCLKLRFLDSLSVKEAAQPRVSAWPTPRFFNTGRCEWRANTRSVEVAVID